MLRFGRWFAGLALLFLLAVIVWPGDGSDDGAMHSASADDRASAAPTVPLWSTSSPTPAPPFQYDDTGLAELGCVDWRDEINDLIRIGDPQCAQSVWTTDQMWEAVQAEDCTTLRKINAYAGSHPELDHDGPVANYAAYQLRRLCE